MCSLSGIIRSMRHRRVQAQRPVPRGQVLAIAIILIGMLVPLMPALSQSPGQPIQEYVVAELPWFHLWHDSTRIRGRIVHFTETEISIEKTTGETTTFPLADLTAIEFVLVTDRAIRGRLVDWQSPRTYLIEIEGGRQVKVFGTIAPLSTTQPSPPVADDRLIARTQLPGEAKTATNAKSLIEVAAKPTKEDRGQMVFAIRISPPPSIPLTIAYVTIDRTAKAGKDYTTQSGLLRVEPGATTAQLSVPIIDDQIAEDDEQFVLFLSVGPNAANILEQNPVATIQDDDSSRQ